jgi:predicted dehydrogenase
VNHINRRDFVKGSAALAATTMIGPLIRTASAQPSRYRIKVGVIGCGGRGTGAAINALEASKDTEIHALADVFADRLKSCRESLESRTDEIGERIMLRDAHCFTGFDAHSQLLETDVDVVILTTPPHFRSMHMAEAIARGKHVFAEKPVATDPVGVRTVLAAAEEADKRNLSIVVGTQRRYETCYLEAMRRIKEGAIGKIVSASCYWNQGGLWMVERKPEMSDMEWQLRNWLYFTWLSGDHIVEQHMHNIDVINWALDSHPIRCTGMGGRQVRTGSNYGNVFDHFAVEYEYENGVSVTSMCRQIDGCGGRVEEVLRGSDGVCSMSMGWAKIEGANPWRFADQDNNPYIDEHFHLIKAITSGDQINAARAAAESTLTAIMGRMSAYTGKSVTWEQAMNSKLDLSPPKYEFGDLPVAEVAVPGRTPLI